MNNEKLNLIVDNRETKIIELLELQTDRFIFETKQLDAGDIIVSEEVAIERKTGADFITSIIDGRLFPQLLKLFDLYTSPVLILESLDDAVFENTGMNLSSIYGALAYVAYKMGVAVIPTRNINDSLIVLERIAFREQVKDEKPIMSRRAPKGMSIEDRRAFILEGLIDTGPKKSEMLIKEFETPLKVFKAIKETEIIYTRTGNPKGIKGPLEDLKGFGVKFIQKNKKLIG